MAVGCSPAYEGDNNPRHRLTRFDFALAGATSGAFTRSVLQPLDVLKIRFQLQEEPVKRGVTFSKYQSMWQAASSIVREEGSTALWKGHVPAQALSVVYGVAQFVTFETLTHTTHPLLPIFISVGSLKPVYHFMCGGVSGCVATLASLPLDVLRTRLVSQGEPKVYRSIPQAVIAMYQEAGMRTFYKGLSPTLVQLFPQTGLQFGFYAFFTKLSTSTRDRTDSHSLSSLQSLVCGGMAGVCAKSTVYPLDVFKKRLQVQGFEQARRHFGQVTRYAGLVHCARSVARREGVRGLFKGLSPSLLKAFCSTGLTFASYEQCCQWLADAK